MLSPFIGSCYLSSIHASHVMLHHLPPSWNAEEDDPEVDWDYLRTVTVVMTSMVFNFLFCDCNG